jgi:CheY-like chemotaxis protein
MSPHNKSILIVDDDPGVRDSYDQILSSKPVSDIMSKGKDLFDAKDEDSVASPKLQYDITLTDCGEAGVSAVQEALSRQSPYAAAFIDMMMPGIDGAETAKQIWPSIRPRSGNLPGP